MMTVPDQEHLQYKKHKSIKVMSTTQQNKCNTNLTKEDKSKCIMKTNILSMCFLYSSDPIASIFNYSHQYSCHSISDQTHPCLRWQLLWRYLKGKRCDSQSLLFRSRPNIFLFSSPSVLQLNSCQMHPLETIRQTTSVIYSRHRNLPRAPRSLAPSACGIVFGVYEPVNT